MWGSLRIALASFPGLLRGGRGEGLIPTMCWQVQQSILCLKSMGWPPDLCTSDCAKRAPTLFRDLRRSMDVARATSKFCSKLKLSKPIISRYIEDDELRSKGKYTRYYQYVIGLFKSWIITVTAHVHTVDNRPSSPPLLRRPGVEARLSPTVEKHTVHIKIAILTSNTYMYTWHSPSVYGLSAMTTTLLYSIPANIHLCYLSQWSL